jgi:D-alanyl-D-alanine carboxypeptidase/D-alanyl-D-alanine-endopeptidase (penicillin-binding protein 4)
MAVRVDSLRTGERLYARNAAKLVMPASNMKLLTLAAAAERLGWDYRFDTRLEAAGVIENGTLRGDLVVVGGGDPSIMSMDNGPAPAFVEWAETLWQSGVRRVDGRLVGDDSAFDDEGRGAGWSWDYLTAGYAAPSGALSYNENVVVVRVYPGLAAGDPARVEVSPPGFTADVSGGLRTADAASRAAITVTLLPGTSRLAVRGAVPAGGAVVARTTAVDNPTRFFVEGLRDALAARGIAVRDGAWDIDDVATLPATTSRRVIATRRSQPLSAIAGYFVKVSQNFYAETLLKTLGRTDARAGSAANGRQVVRDVLQAWGIPPDAYVMSDGSGLSRYDYVTADTIVTLLEHVWTDERLRGPFLAALPVGGRDGTLESRMKGTVLDDNVQAKTGTIANVRSLSGFLETKHGEKLVFSMIANHFTASSAQVDAIVEQALARLVDK